MCLYPKLIKNRKYTATKKNKGIIPDIPDERVKYVPIGCGNCMECRKQKAREWQVRLSEEIRINRSGLFVTLSYSNQSLINLEFEIRKRNIKLINELASLGDNPDNQLQELQGYDLDNAIAKLSVRRFLERWRKKYKKSVKHWLITELGQTNTERLHLHGLLFTDKDKETINTIWKYGNIWIGDYVNEKTINYIVKYLSKTDKIHKTYKPIILSSPGIGKNYMNRPDVKRNSFKDEDTNEMYKTRTGIELPLPIYYRNHIYNEDEKEILWLNLLDKQKRYVDGIEIDVSDNENEYWKVLKIKQRENEKLGYGTPSDTDLIKYERQLRNLKRLKIKK